MHYTIDYHPNKNSFMRDDKVVFLFSVCLVTQVPRLHLLNYPHSVACVENLGQSFSTPTDFRPFIWPENERSSKNRIIPNLVSIFSGTTKATGARGERRENLLAVGLHQSSPFFNLVVIIPSSPFPFFPSFSA